MNERFEAHAQEAAHAARDRRSHILIYLGGTAVIVAVLGLALLWWGQRGQIQQLRADGNTLASQGQQLAQQVRQLGGTPVVEPATPGPQGPQGLPGATGATGLAGAKGDKGDPGVPGTPGATGAKGDPGQQGTAGQNGPDGKTGPAGATGATGPAGPQGRQGEQGPPGPAGAAGEPGQPPSGWTTTYPDGSTETCSRGANFNPDSPQYQCTVQQPSGSSTPSTTAVLPSTIRRRST